MVSDFALSHHRTHELVSFVRIDGVLQQIEEAKTVWASFLELEASELTPGDVANHSADTFVGPGRHAVPSFSKAIWSINEEHYRSME